MAAADEVPPHHQLFGEGRSTEQQRTGRDVGEVAQGQHVAPRRLERQIRDADAFLLGRVTYEMFAGYWPTLTHNEFGVADKLNSAPKYVVSTTLQKADWNNSTQIKSNVFEEIRKLKQGPGGDIAIIGSARLVHSLLGAGLIDEVQVLVHPLVLGKGVRLFPDGYHASLKLAGTQVLPHGVVYMSYHIEP